MTAAKSRSRFRKTRQKRSIAPAPKLNFNKCAWIAVCAAVAFSAYVRIRLINIPFERDEGEFAYMGQLMLQGVPPYKIAHNMKMPGIYAAYALFMAVFGQSVAGVHFGFLLANAATIVCVFLLARRVFDPLAGAVAAVSYAVLSTNSSILGTSAHATHFVVVFALPGFLLLLRAIKREQRWLYLLSGVCFGISFLMKQPGGTYGLFAFLCVAWQALKQKTRWKQSLKSLAALAVGGALPVAATLIVLWAAGVFENFYFWTVTYCRHYAAQVPITLAPRLFYTSTKTVTMHTWPLYLAGIIGLAVVVADRKYRTTKGFAAWFFAFSFAAICAGFYFRSHYYVPLLPALAMLGGCAVSWLWERTTASERLKSWAFASILVFAAALMYPIWKDAKFLFQLSPVEACRMMYDGNPFPESIPIARWIAADTTGKDTIAVIGSEPQIYFYARRRAAISYIYMYPLMELHPFARKMQEHAVRELETVKPRYLVFVSVPTSWLKSPKSETILLDWLSRNADRLYERVGLVEIYQDEAVYYWGDEVLGLEPSSPLFVSIHKRRGG